VTINTLRIRITVPIAAVQGTCKPATLKLGDDLLVIITTIREAGRKSEAIHRRCTGRSELLVMASTSL
jgi:hypothetical protein